MSNPHLSSKGLFVYEEMKWKSTQRQKKFTLVCLVVNLYEWSDPPLRSKILLRLTTSTHYISLCKTEVKKKTGLAEADPVSSFSLSALAVSIVSSSSLSLILKISSSPLQTPAISVSLPLLLKISSSSLQTLAPLSSSTLFSSSPSPLLFLPSKPKPSLSNPNTKA